MKEYLFLFHSTVGVIQTRKALQAAGMTFRVSDIPRDLRGGCQVMHLADLSAWRGNSMGDPWAYGISLLSAGWWLALHCTLRDFSALRIH